MIAFRVGWIMLSLAALLAAPQAAYAGDITPTEARLIGIELGTGSLYEVSQLDASVTKIGETEITNVGALEAHPDGTLYGFTSGADSALVEINPNTAATTSVGALGAGFVFEGGLAISPGGSAFGTNLGSATSPSLLSVDLSNGSASLIGSLGSNHDFNGLTWRSDGMLVGLDRVTSALWEIDPATAALGSMIGVSLSPTLGSIGSLASMDGSTGFFTTAGASTTPGSNELWEIDFFSGVHSLIGQLLLPTGSAGLSGLAVVVEPIPAPEPSYVALLGLGLAAIAIIRRR